MQKFNAYNLSWLVQELVHAGLIKVDEHQFGKWYGIINDGNHNDPDHHNHSEMFLLACIDRLRGFCDEHVFAKLEAVLEDYPDVNWTDALSRFQIRSKLTAYKTLKAAEAYYGDIWIMGGWVGVLPMFLIDALPKDSYTNIVSYDLDDTANKAGERLVDSPRYRTENKDIYTLDYTNFSGTIVNTICEHLNDFKGWQRTIPQNTLMLLQSNNMFGVDDHCNCVNSLDEFIAQIEYREIIHTETSTYSDLGDRYERYTVLALR